MQHDNIKTGRGETMAEDKNSKVTQNQDRINKLIDGLTLFDDDLMSRVFDKNIEATELLLRIILEKDQGYQCNRTGRNEKRCSRGT